MESSENNYIVARKQLLSEAGRNEIERSNDRGVSITRRFCSIECTLNRTNHFSRFAFVNGKSALSQFEDYRRATLPALNATGKARKSRGR